MIQASLNMEFLALAERLMEQHGLVGTWRFDAHILTGFDDEPTAVVAYSKIKIAKED